MLKRISLLVLVVLVMTQVADAQKSKPAKSPKGKGAPAGKLLTHEDSVAFAMGVSMYAQTAQSGVAEFNFDLFVKGMEAQKSGKSAMSVVAADSIIRVEMKCIADKKTEMNKQEGEAFLANNKSRPGVITTPTGLQYRADKEGNGVKPDANDKVTVHYHGTLIDGSVFDSSVNRGKTASFGLNQVITGWTEGLQYMSEGSKYTFFIPHNLAYGARGQGKILPYSTLIFEVELFSVEKVN